MKIFPAIDIIDGNVVRLLKGDYSKKTVYGENPVAVAEKFEKNGAQFLHVVDLDGAKSGDTANFDVVKRLCRDTSLNVEIGGGIRDESTIEKYINAGVYRVILGTVAIKNPEFTTDMIKKYGDKIAVGVDLHEGMVAIHGWTEVSRISADEIFEKLCHDGASCVICTDISKDGAMEGTNRHLYRRLSEKYNIDIVASGGISSVEDVEALNELNIYGAIIGKALYNGAIDLKKIIALTEDKNREEM